MKVEMSAEIEATASATAGIYSTPATGGKKQIDASAAAETIHKQQPQKHLQQLINSSNN
jgi:hypothetical protein